jgi:hypothetical protein
MRCKNFDTTSADQAGVRHLDDRQVFGRAWQLNRMLVTRDAGFLNDAIFPLRACSGLLVLPVYGPSESSETCHEIAGGPTFAGRW